VLAAEIRYRNPGLVFLQHRIDLLFAKLALLYLRLLPTESNSKRGRFRGQRHALPIDEIRHKRAGDVDRPTAHVSLRDPPTQPFLFPLAQRLPFPQPPSVQSATFSGSPQRYN